VRWCVERIRRDLAVAGGRDPTSLALVGFADRLLQLLADVRPAMPRRLGMGRSGSGTQLEDMVVRRGLEAIGWVADERGLGGGRELDGLAWHLPLSELWECYVETVVRREAALVGADVRTGRQGQTTFPIRWTDPGLRGMSHLVPDFVVRHRDHVKIVDAKYKAHFAELDEAGWIRMADDAREAHRADFHQVLAYAALFDAKQTTVSLVYPLRRATFEALEKRRRDVVRADLSFGGRVVRAELRGVPFGGSGSHQA
jgi:hypothetical protein